MRPYMTASEVLGAPLSPEEVRHYVTAAPVRDLLACVGWLMLFIRKHELMAPETSGDLVDRLLVGDAKMRAQALLRSGSVTLAPQVLIAVAKLALMLHDPKRQATSSEPMHDVVAAALGLAEYLGTDDEGEAQWAGQSAALSMELVSNQHFNSTLDEGSALSRYWAHWHDLPRTRDPEAAEAHETAFEQATGVSLTTCFRVGFLLYAHANSTDVALFPPDYAAANRFDDDDRRALDLFTTEVEQARELVRDEVARTGFDWSANTLRRFPLIRHPDGSMTLIDPDFLVQRACGSAAYWELHNHFKRSGKQQWGDFKRFRGLVVEDSVAEGLESLTRSPDGGAQRLWTERELQQAWPGLKCCDFVLDFGMDWVCVEVVSHMLSEAASTGRSTEALDKEIRIVVEEKATQLDATALRLLQDESVLTGRPSVPGRRVLPVVVAGYGFPVNPITMSVIHDRLADAELLADSRIGPLEILDERNLEEMEQVQESGGPAFNELLRSKQAAGMRLASMDQFLFHELRLRLHRPSRMKARMDAAFKVLTAWAEERSKPSES
jgi:hypothetical protein